jgi:hypothetical protein
MEQVLNVLLNYTSAAISKASALLFTELQAYIGALLRSNFHKGKVNIPKYKEHKRFYKKAIELPVNGEEKIKAGNNRPGIKGANKGLT